MAPCHLEEKLMSSLQSAQMFSVEQFGTVKYKITGTKQHDIKEHHTQCQRNDCRELYPSK